MSDDEPDPGSVETPAESVLAGEIRRRRELAGLSHAQLANRIGYSRQYVSRAERPGRGLASADLVRSVDTALQAGGALSALHAQATTERRARRLPARTTPAASTVSTLPADDGRSAPTIVASTVSDHSHTVPARLTAAGDESSRFLEWSERENVGELSIEGMQAELLRVTRTYLAVPTLPLFERTRLLRDRVFGLLEGRRRPLWTRELYAIAGWSMTVLAWMSTDLDDPYSAEEHLRAAWGCAEYADHDGLRAWVRATQHTTSFWQKRYADAAGYAEDGLRYVSNGTAELFLAGAYAIDLAKLGDRHGAVRALRDAHDSVDHADLVGDELAGPFTCTFSRAAGGLWSDAYLELDQPAEALTYIELAYPVGVAITGDRNLGSERMALCQKAKTHLMLGEHDGAVEALAPALETAVDLRVRPLVERISQIGHLVRSLDKHSVSSAALLAATETFVKVGHHWATTAQPPRAKEAGDDR